MRPRQLGVVPQGQGHQPRPARPPAHAAAAVAAVALRGPEGRLPVGRGGDPDPGHRRRLLLAQVLPLQVVPHRRASGRDGHADGALKSASSKFSKFCALICSPSLPILDQKAADSQCGENASCKEAGTGVGLCTYDD